MFFESSPGAFLSIHFLCKFLPRARARARLHVTGRSYGRAFLFC